MKRRKKKRFDEGKDEDDATMKMKIRVMREKLMTMMAVK
jgi:hypothetical protein